MSQTENHLAWCLKDSNRLKKTNPDLELAKKHLAKSEHNFEVSKALEKLNFPDWALNVGFYAIYHCFLAILAKYGYESRNQSCTVTVLLTLINEKKLLLDKDLILEFDSLDPESKIMSTARANRETATYGVETSIDLNQLKKVKDLVLKVQRETIKIMGEQ